MKKFKLFLLSILLVSCNACDSFRAKSVCEIVNNTNKYRDSEQIIVKGVVTDGWDLLLIKYFILADTEGQCALAVQTDKITPDIGREVTIRGIITNSIEFQGEKFILIKELAEE